jgi:signal transduction histidine kinase
MMLMTGWLFLAFGWSALFVPQFWGGVSGAVSGMLLGWGYGLFGVAQGTWSFRWQTRLQPRGLHQMLLAMPLVAMAAGVLATVAGVVMLPSAIAMPIYTLVLVPCILVVVFSWRAVSESTRFLYRHAEEQATAAARARAEAADMQLAALQAQMNPHFLFNALNTIAALVRTEPRRAEQMVENLAAILRRTLQRSRHTLTTVEEEIDFLRAYLGIEQERFGERLIVEWVLEPDALHDLIPPMTLQPLVENALKHGIAERLDGGRIRVAAHREGERLILAVDDDGIGFPHRYREGTGLGNLRQRLQTLYGERGELRVERIEEGARVVIEVPRLDRHSNVPSGIGAG